MAQTVKNLPAMGDLDSIPGLGRSPRVWNGYPLQDPLHGQGSLVGDSPWCHKESDTTERLTLSFSLRCYRVGNRVDILPKMWAGNWQV